MKLSLPWFHGVFDATGDACFVARDEHRIIAAYERPFGFGLLGRGLTFYTTTEGRGRRARTYAKVTFGAPLDPEQSTALSWRLERARRPNDQAATIAADIVKRGMKAGLDRGDMNVSAIEDKVRECGLLAIDKLASREPGWFASAYNASPDTTRIVLALRSLGEGDLTKASLKNIERVIQIARHENAA